MKRKLFAGALILICLSVLVGGTMAYFTKSDTAHNVITSGEINIELLEWADEGKTTPFPEEGTEGVMPGAEVIKIVEIKNTGANEAYVRIQIKKDIALADGMNIDPDTGLLKIEFNATDWTAQDGFYYYNEALLPGETTTPLFTSVVFDPTMGNDYQNSTATVDVTAQAVQVANNGTSALTAAGWPE